MKPSKFIAYQERLLGRALTPTELDVLQAAREVCTGGKRDTVKAMWLALQAKTTPRGHS